MKAQDLLAQELAPMVAKLLADSPHRRLLKVAEAAQYMSCSVQQIRNWFAAKKLTRVRVDSFDRIDVRDLDRMIEENKE